MQSYLHYSWLIALPTICCLLMNTALTPVSNTVPHRFASLAPHYAVTQPNLLHAPHSLSVLCYTPQTLNRRMKIENVNVVCRTDYAWVCGHSLPLIARSNHAQAHGYASLVSVVVVRRRSPVQSSPTDSGVSECVFEASTMMRRKSVSGCSYIKKITFNQKWLLCSPKRW